MADRQLSKDQYQAAVASSNSVAEWLAKQDSSDLMVATGGNYAGVQDRVDYTGKTTHHTKTVTDTELIHGRIASCREAYENSGLIGNAIDLMVDFAMESMIIVHESLPIQKFYWQWAKRVRLGDIAAQILKAYFIDGNVPILTFRGRIKPAEIRRYRQAQSQKMGAQAADSLFLPPSFDRRRILPYRYSVLDVLRLRQEGSELLGTQRWEYQIDTEDLKYLKDPNSSVTTSEQIRRLKIAMGDDFNQLAERGRLRIDPARLSMLFYKKDGFKKWANPMLWRIIDDLKFKSSLRDMDISVVESVINTLVIIKLGNTAEGFPPTKEMFQKMAALLKTPAKSQTLIWNDMIDILAAYPPVEKILGAEKYSQVDNDIRNGLGISESILGGSTGSGGKFANSFLSVKTLLERLEGARTALLEWITEQFEIVAQAMDFRKPAWVKLDHVDLVDQNQEKQLLLELVDRGMISYQTCVERFGENFDIEIERMKREDRFRKANETKFPYVLVKAGKYGPQLTNGPLPFFSLLDKEELNGMKNSPEMKKMAQTPTQQGGQGDKGGRPANTKKPQKTKQTPRNKPKGQDGSGAPKGSTPKKAAASASVQDPNFVLGGRLFDKIYRAIAVSVTKARKLDSGHDLTDEDRQVIYQSVARVIGEFEDTDDVNKENLELILRSVNSDDELSAQDKLDTPAIDTQVFDLTEKLVARFNKSNERLPNKSEMKDMISTAFALSRSNGNS